MPTPDAKTLETRDIAALFAGIEKINHRLDKLERERRSLKSDNANARLSHPSLDKFDIAEAIANEIFAAYPDEKACQFEPDKPCDHCSMCNSRGF